MLSRPLRPRPRLARLGWRVGDEQCGAEPKLRSRTSTVRKVVRTPAARAQRRRASTRRFTRHRAASSAACCARSRRGQALDVRFGPNFTMLTLYEMGMMAAAKPCAHGVIVERARGSDAGCLRARPSEPPTERASRGMALLGRGRLLGRRRCGRRHLRVNRHARRAHGAHRRDAERRRGGRDRGREAPVRDGRLRRPRG